MAHTASVPNGNTTTAVPTSNGQVPVAVNKKKAKRRAKKAEKENRENAEFHARGALSNGFQSFHDQSQQDPRTTHPLYDPADPPYEATDFNSDEDTQSHYNHRRSSSSNSYSNPASATSSSRNRRDSRRRSHSRSNTRPSQPTTTDQSMTMSKDKIWNTSSHEERQRIKAFWLSLSEEDRKRLVRIEKDAVLKKMKEQQRHSCSCQVCGRKRIAIEEELEVLYDAYYKELEEYANKQAAPPLLSESRRFGLLNGLHPPNRIPPALRAPRPFRRPARERSHDRGGQSEQYSDDLDDNEYSADDDIPSMRPPHADDFFNFGQSLTVKGGILTVADDLLKNDGKRFIEMMEQLAERRMAREEDARKDHRRCHPPPTPYHGPMHQAPLDPEDDDDDYDSQEEDEEYDDDDEDYEEEEEEEEDMAMTEKQRTEEGRRMFQIFAARMFEQRVLNAYKEQLATERQKSLIELVDKESQTAEAKRLKKLKDAAKKKEKVQAKKLREREEKQRREDEKAAEEAAAKKVEEEKAEAQRLRNEAKRKAREAQKKADEEEKARKEALREKSQQIQREKEAELRKKAKEQKERERVEKEEARRKDKEAREAKDREAREKKEQAERDKLLAAEAEIEAKTDRLSKAHPKEQDKSSAPSTSPTPTQIARRPQSQAQAPVPLPPSLQTQQSLPSPRVAIATPTIPKIAPPQRQSSAASRETAPLPHTPHFGSIASSSSSPHPSTPQQNSPVPSHLARKASQSFQGGPQAISPLHSSLSNGPFVSNPFGGMPASGLNGYPPGMPTNAHFGPRHYDPMHHQQARIPGGFSMPFNGSNGSIQQGRAFPPPNNPHPPGFHSQNSFGSINTFDGVGSVQPRQASFAFDRSSSDQTSSAAQPIARPNPIGRPSSGDHVEKDGDDIDELTGHFGSSALLDDDANEPLTRDSQRRSSAAPGSLPRSGFVPPLSNGLDNMGFHSAVGVGLGTWGSTPYSSSFGPSSLPSASNAGGWPTSTNMLPIGGPAGSGSRSATRHVAIRLMLCDACKQLDSSSSSASNEYHALAMVRAMIQRSTLYNDHKPITDAEILQLCETEGSTLNGGGVFDVRSEAGSHAIKFTPSGQALSHKTLGEIGSPVVGPRQLRSSFQAGDIGGQFGFGGQPFDRANSGWSSWTPHA